MRLYEFSELQPGMKTAAPVFGRNKLLLGSGVELTLQTIMRLPLWGIHYVYIQEKESLPEISLA